MLSLIRASIENEMLSSVASLDQARHLLSVASQTVSHHPDRFSRQTGIPYVKMSEADLKK